VLEDTSFKVHLNKYFEVGAGDVSCSFDEIIQYASFFCRGSASLQIHHVVESEGLFTRDFTHVGAYLADSYSTTTTSAAFCRYVFD
jgi:hypothetical protein